MLRKKWNDWFLSMFFFSGNSLRKTSHGKTLACLVYLFVWSAKDQHFDCEFSWTSMTNTQTLAAHLRTISRSVRENTNIQYRMCLLGTIFLSVCILTLVFSLKPCLWPSLCCSLFCYIAGPLHMHSPGNLALKLSKHTICSSLRPRPIIHISLISFSAMFAIINY